MASQLTVTGKVGPNKSLTAGVFTDIASWSVDENAILTMVSRNNGQTIQVSITAATVFTVTVVAAGNYTVVIS